MPKRSMDYNTIASVYDRRYATNDYSGVRKTLLAFAGQPAAGLILEIGCGSGHWLQELASLGHRVLGLDPSAGMLEQARRKALPVVNGRSEFLPLCDASIDRIYCLNSFHHFSDHRQFISEAYRVLKPGGGLLIVGLDPHTGLDRWSIYEYFPQVLEIDRKRYHPTSQIRQMLADRGFEKCETLQAQNIPGYLSARYALENGLMDRAVTSQLTLLTEKEYNQGISRLRQDADRAEANNATLLIGADLRLYATAAWKRKR